jgi:Domain of unknown function DUF302
MPNPQSEPARARNKPTANGGDELITKLSPWSVADTVSRLSAVVAARGMKEFAVIDHSGEARASGLDLRDTKLVIFGSPQAGTPVMVAAPLAALDLPLKVLVWGGRTPDEAQLHRAGRACRPLWPQRRVGRTARRHRRAN